MNIYVLHRINKVGYDEYDGTVICAKSKKRALNLGSFLQGPADIKYVGKAGKKQKEGVILSSFNNG